MTLDISWSTADGRGDWTLASYGLASGPALEAAVYVSLFSDRRAGRDDRLPPGEDRRGWWGDSFDTKPVGSRLWLLLRAKRTTETLRRARDMIAEALAWLVDDGIAASIDVTTEWTRRTLLGARVVLTGRDGTQRVFNYGWAWAEVG